MTYKVNDDLPYKLRKLLPEDAQDIFREAFNLAYKEHEDQIREEVKIILAYKAAWNAVKIKYHKNEETGKWVKNKIEINK